MMYHGRVQDGKIVLTGGAQLPEGAEVRVDVVEPSAALNGETTPLFDVLKPVIGCLKDAPPDLAQNHDHYLYGLPKRA